MCPKISGKITFSQEETRKVYVVLIIVVVVIVVVVVEVVIVVKRNNCYRAPTPKHMRSSITKNADF